MLAATSTRRIGLSLGADLCWPACYEGILKRLSPRLNTDQGSIQFEVERVAIEPFSMHQPCPYDVVIDRLTHWYPVTREWLKKSILMDDLYVYNNPWSIQSMEKHTTYCAMSQLGFPIPETWMVPPKTYLPLPDLQVTLDRYARLFDLSAIGEKIGYPLYMKPYDGGAWRGVSQITDASSLQRAYDESGTNIMHLQKGVDDFDLFVRCIGLGPQFHLIQYDPKAPLHDRYTMNRHFLSAEEAQYLRDMTLTINTFFGWDFNSCEAIRKDGKWYLIDFANACPDSQVTSLHFHFPWLVLAHLRWSLYVAATRKRMRKTLDWDPFYQVADQSSHWNERLTGYAAIGNARMETEAFTAFCQKHLSDLEAIAFDFFHSQEAKDAVAQKTASLFPAHEVETFTHLFLSRAQQGMQAIRDASLSPC